MCEMICPKCRAVIEGRDEHHASTEYSWHWIETHENEPPEVPC